MTDYTARANDFEFSSRVAGVRDRLSEVDEQDQVEMAEFGEPYLLQRLELLLDRVLTVTGATIPATIPQTHLSTLAAAIDAVYNGLGGMIHHPHPADVEVLSGAVEDLALQLMEWPASIAEDAITQAAGSYRRSLGQQLISVREQFQSLEQQMTLLRNQLVDVDTGSRTFLEDVETRSRKQIAAVEQEIVSLKTSVAGLVTQADRALARTDEAVGRFENQFSAGQAARAAEHQQQLQAVDDSVAELTTRLTKDAAEAYAEIAKQATKAGDLASLFAAKGTANAYGDEAKDQAKVADTWRFFAVFFAGAATVLAAGLLVFNLGGTDTSAIVTRTLVVLALGGLAAYAAKQSGTHRRREERARQRELDIVAFGPFIYELDPEKQTEARMEFVGKIFAGDAADGHHDARSISDDQVNVVSRLADVFLKLRP